MLRGGNPLTNVCGSPFIDPGAVVIAPLAAVAAGDSYSLALKTDGTVAGWGDNSWGETSIPPGLVNVTGIFAGYIHCLALKTDGTVVGWGDDSFGETNTPAGLSNVVTIATGWGYSLALKAMALWLIGEKIILHQRQFLQDWSRCRGHFCWL